MDKNKLTAIILYKFRLPLSGQSAARAVACLAKWISLCRGIIYLSSERLLQFGVIRNDSVYIDVSFIYAPAIAQTEKRYASALSAAHTYHSTINSFKRVDANAICIDNKGYFANVIKPLCIIKASRLASNWNAMRSERNKMFFIIDTHCGTDIAING